MAPALVHFLAGATLVLFGAAPLAVRGHLAGRHLWLVAVGGLWGMIPDSHYITPVFRPELAALHRTHWGDLCAFHYALDQPPIATRELESIAVAVASFLVAITVFTAATAVGDRRTRAARSPRAELVARTLLTGYAASLAAMIAAVAAGLVLTWTGRIDTVAALYGRESAVAGWLLLGGGSLVASGVFAALFALLRHRWDVTSSRAGAALGLLFGVAGWLTVVVIAAPVWMRVVLDLPRPIPYVHLMSLPALVVFGLVLGTVYPLVRRILFPPEMDQIGS
ncbi:hypothetical protein [Natrialba asiatica]|uniref:Uncharacterized protein n=1 Tax=Natrialba asiatica (strain ATCC 700177 / DSM 12278 / JCM 9576 / FERM P-10747 / NBRC 102637 / 172P1) TaxID=29540 RepID=M0ASZ1_NATA1|nr:hypothetical protein [Natrialba asiatica]ELZ01831.1 hypothetical protein C481_09932 [Natrialba asiatica DSM 12278]